MRHSFIPKLVSLEIWKYLDNQTLLRVSRLSKKVRESLQDSQIAREGREVTISYKQLDSLYDCEFNASDD